MSRITKDPQERITEIMNMAEALFVEKGYDETTISDIVKKIGIAQGTFYYYFRSKVEILDAIITYHADEMFHALNIYAQDQRLRAPTKLQRMIETIIGLINKKEGLLFGYLCDAKHAYILQKIDQKIAERLVPQFLEVMRQGISEKTMDVEYPEEAVHLVGAIIRVYIDGLYDGTTSSVMEHKVITVREFLIRALRMDREHFTLSTSVK